MQAVCESAQFVCYGHLSWCVNTVPTHGVVVAVVQAMGDYPYASDYMLNGRGTLPAYPVAAACRHLDKPHLEGAALLRGLSHAVGTFYNYSATLPCFNFTEGPNPESDEDGNFWDYQACTEMVMPFSRDGGQTQC